jgi:chromosome segregation ATPase
LKAEIFEIQ